MDAELVIEQLRVHLRETKAKHQVACNRRQETLHDHHYHIGLRQAYENIETALTDLIRKSNAPATGDEAP